MNYKEARQYLETISAAGNHLGLRSIELLLQELGNPQDHLKFVHVAGTNGKGSVLAYTASVLEEAGYRVGRYISPTLFSYEEKIQVNGKYMSQSDLVRLVEKIAEARKRIHERGEREQRPEEYPDTTIFEVETVLSFLYFCEQRCDLVLLETGMGGREDATNIVKTTLLEIIVRISMDHMEFLGSSLAEIAWNKAGIIKKGTRVVSAVQKKEAADVLEACCREESAELSYTEPEKITDIHYGLDEQSFCYKGFSVCIHLAGTCQIWNAALAIEGILALRQLRFFIPDEAVIKGMEKTRWEGRFQKVLEKPLVIMDGAHNPDAAGQLMQAVETYFGEKTIYYIFGVFSDKEYDKIIEITAQRAKKIYTVETKNNVRAMPAAELARHVKLVNPATEAVGDVKKALDLAREEASADDVILVFGSLSFLWEVREYAEKCSREERIQ